MKRDTAAYLAGVFDTFGTTTLTVSEGKLLVTVVVETSNDSAVWEIVRNFRGDVMTAHDGRQMRWCATQLIALRFLRSVQPFLRSKQGDYEYVTKAWEIRHDLQRVWEVIGEYQQYQRRAAASHA